MIKMFHANLLSFLDLLDLDEELIDSRLKAIIGRTKYSNEHLLNAIKLLQYKQLINLQDFNDCDNDEECEFAVKLIKQIDMENIDYVCEIVSITLELNKNTVVANAEHLVQQLLLDMPFTEIKDYSEDKLSLTNTLVSSFKIIDSVLNAVIKCEKMIYLPFLDLPLNKILLCADEKVKNHFLSSTVPKLFQAVIGNKILDCIWMCICRLESDNVENILKVLGFLSEYYLPIEDSTGKLFESNIYYQYKFWYFIFIGMLSGDLMSRKLATYLAKRAIDCVTVLKKDIVVESPDNCIIFKWIYSKSQILQTTWNNFFILLDSLEEKQCNIVLPSLKLFDSLENLDCWLNCAFNIGLKHDNTQVRYQCILHRLSTKLCSQTEARVLLEALNDINIYDSSREAEILKTKLIVYLADKRVLEHIFVSIPIIKWSAVPLFHLSDVLAKGLYKCFPISDQLRVTVIDVLKIPCNSTELRRAIHINILQFIGNSSIKLHWKEYITIYSNLKLNFAESQHIDNPFLSYIKKSLPIEENEKQAFFQLLMESHLYIDFTFLYLLGHKDNLEFYYNLLREKLVKIENIVSRQYSDKKESLNDVIYVIQVFCQTILKENTFMETVYSIISLKYKSILLYIMNVLSSNSALPLESIILICTGLNTMSIEIKDNTIKDIMLQLYRTCIIFIQDENTVIENSVMGLGILEILLKDPIMISNYNHEMINFKDIIKFATKIDNKPGDGRLKNIFYERATEIIYGLFKADEIERNLDAILKYVQTVIESGGYGCLRVCLKIINKILSQVLEQHSSECNINDLITRLWKEIEELKSNRQYNPCIEEFIHLITHDSLINLPVHNNTVMFYCKQVIDYGSLKTAPLYFLIKSLNNKDLTVKCGHLIYVFCDILLYSPVPRKDQRISDNLVIEVLKVPRYGFNKNVSNHYFNYEIEFMSTLVLSKIKDAEVLASIETLIERKVTDSFKNKQRYHGHSQAHRLLLKALQNLLLIVLLKPSNHEGGTMIWCIDILGHLPHQPSVRTCLEWYIALQLYIKKTSLDEEMFKLLSKIPLTSQLMVAYWVAKRKIAVGTCSKTEYEFVMNTLLSHTMGQIFSIRLHAQYLANKLYLLKRSDSYSCIINVIQKTFSESANDKNFMKFQSDYFANDFDIVRDLTPSFICYILPRYCEISNNELVDFDYVREIIQDITSGIKSNQTDNEFNKEWSSSCKSDGEIFAISIAGHEESTTIDDKKSMGTIQKKYVPWKNMSDLNMYETQKKRSNSELIVVASLIDKLPNLGGMARTGEVFGVKTYVVDSLRHLQDRQFQGLSVSAERWIDVEEVRPGTALKQYLIAKKSEGYSVVAAEQTSTSCKLQSFKFPRKTLLLLGHEKEGIPCDLLPIMDYCVEIPQQGFVRSLNVHVTAAIFIWEYSRQNILK